MADNTGRREEASEQLTGRKPTVEISPDRLSSLLRNNGEPEAYTSATQAIDALAIDLPDPDADPMIGDGTTPPQFAHTLRREPAHTPIASAPAERTDAATIAMRRVRAPLGTEAPRRDVDPRDEIQTAADLPSARRPHRASASPLIRHPVVRMAPLSAADAPHSSAASLAVTVPIPIDALPALTSAAADGSQPHLPVPSEPALDPALAADIAAAVQPTWVSLLAPVRAGEPTQEVALADVLHVETVRPADEAPRGEPALALAPTPRVPAAPPLDLALAATFEPVAARDDLDEATLLDAEVLTAPPPSAPASPATITSESPGVALAATRSFELPAITIAPHDADAGEPSVIVDAALTTAPASSSARWPLGDHPAAAPFAVPLDVLVGRMPGPPVAAHPTWATRRITAPRHVLVPVLVLAALITTLYAIACAMF